MEEVIITALGGFLLTAISGIIGNRTDGAFVSVSRSIAKRVKDEKIINSDLQKSVRRSFILSLKNICEDCLVELKPIKNQQTENIRWLEAKQYILENELKGLDKAENVEIPIEELDKIELLLIPEKEISGDRLEIIKNKLIEAAIGKAEPPECYKNKVKSTLFKRMCGHFADEIKHNEIVSKIFVGQLLAQIDVELQMQRLTVERIIKHLLSVEDGIVQLTIEMKKEAEDTRGHDSREHENTRKELESFLQAGLERLRQEIIQYRLPRREIKGENIIGLRPVDVRNTFKDRIEKIEELRKLLKDNTVKLIIIVGRGGIGKTALLSKVFEEIELSHLKLTNVSTEMGADGIVYLSCVKKDKTIIERLYSDIAKMLGNPYNDELLKYWKNPSNSIKDKLRFLLSKLKDGCYLLVLDNLEFMLTPDNTLEDPDLMTFVDLCLTTPHGLRIVATSRERLVTGTTGVHTRLLPLENGLPENDAIALLRYFDPTGDLGLKDAPEKLLQKIALMTFGFPKALEIIVGILYKKTTTNYLNKLMMDSSLFNTEVVENLLAEHYKLLSNEEKYVLQVLSVFGKPVPSVAVKYVLIYLSPNFDVDYVLRTLTYSYFVTYNRRYDTFELHPLDLQYAYNCIPDGDEEYTKQKLHMRAAEFFKELGKQQTKYKNIDDLEPKLQEFHHLVKAGSHNSAYNVLGSMISFLNQASYNELIVNLRSQLIDGLTNNFLKQQNLGYLGMTLIKLGNTQKAIPFLEEAMTIAQEFNFKKDLGRWERGMGKAYYSLGQFNKAIDFYNKSLSIAHSNRDNQEEAADLYALGNAYISVGDIYKAIEYITQAQKVNKYLPRFNEAGEASNLAGLGRAYAELGMSQMSKGFYEKALNISKKVGNQKGVGNNLAGLGRVYGDLGESQNSNEYYKQAIDIAKQIGDQRGEAASLTGLGKSYADMGLLEKAINCYEQALEINNNTSDRNGMAANINAIGSVYLYQGNLQKAKENFTLSLKIARDVGNRRREGKELAGLGHVYYALGDIQQSIQYYEQAQQKYSVIGDKLNQSEVLLGLGCDFHKLGKLAEARVFYEKSLAFNMPLNNYSGKTKLGIIYIQQGDENLAQDYFKHALELCQKILVKNPNHFRANYYLGISMLCMGEKDGAIENYRRALEACSAMGVVKDAIRDLQLLQQITKSPDGLQEAITLLEKGLLNVPSQNNL